MKGGVKSTMKYYQYYQIVLVGMSWVICDVLTRFLRLRSNFLEGKTRLMVFAKCQMAEFTRKCHRSSSSQK